MIQYYLCITKGNDEYDYVTQSLLALRYEPTHL